MSTKAQYNFSPPFVWSEIKSKIVNIEELTAFMKVLYEGNGWIVSQNKIKGQVHTDLLLSYPSNPIQVALIVNLVNIHQPLSFIETREILTQFETIKSYQYHCNQYAVVSVNGFDIKCNQLKEYNLLLNDEKDIKTLIEKYSITQKKEPEIQLFAHNLKTYEKVNTLFENKNKVAVVQATGTGKSYLIAKVLNDFKGKNRLVMAPSHYIIDQIKNHIRWENENITFITYAYAMFISNEWIKQIKPELIILDEFHRCGAEEWGKGVQEILTNYQNAKVLGTSATPIRYLDGGRDMSMELFEGNVAENLSLSQSIVKKILPMPSYITAFYSLKIETEKLSNKINAISQSANEKQNLLNQLEVANINWERTKGVESILQKYIEPNMNKFIVFCKEGEHINEMEQIVSLWFSNAFPNQNVQTYRVISAEAERNNNLKNFINANDANTFHLLLSIDMLNEGLHIEGVSGVILLRPTESPTIFYQQIGRCLKVGFKNKPVIFDFVNNFKSIRTNDFLSDLEYFRKEEKGMRFALGLEEICPPFTIIDEAKEITEVFGQIRFFADSWEIMFNKLLAYKEKYGHCLVPFDWHEDIKLGKWVSAQRSKRFDILPERKEKLEKLGFVWNADDEKWNIAYNQLNEYFNIHGHCDVKPAENKNLAMWNNIQRTQFNSGKLSPVRIKKLNKIKFDWNPIENMWEKKFEEYKHFLLQNFTEKDLFKDENNELMYWVTTQRYNKRKNKLPIEKIDKLNSIGIVWNPIEDKWDIMYQNLCDFKAYYGHCRPPSGVKQYVILSRWCTKQRTNKNAGKLSEERIKKLNELGFEWEISQTNWFIMYDQLVLFYDTFGHVRVTKTAEYEDLFRWCAVHRSTKTIRTLSDERRQLLNNLGFEWKLEDAKWNEKFEKLKKFKEENGHLNISEAWLMENKLRAWFHGIRLRKDKLRPDKLQKLASIGFELDPLESQWYKMFEELKVFKNKNGHTNVPLIGDTFKLAQWVLRHRNYPEKVKEDKQKLLDEMGFEWKHELIQRWEANFDELIEYKNKTGHFNVPSNLEYKSLNKWMLKNLRLKVKGELKPEFAQKFDAIGLTDIPERKGRYIEHPDFRNEKLWEEGYNLLVEFKEENGHLNIPKKYSRLSQWLLKQRKYYKEQKLSALKIKRLIEIGVEFG